MQCRWCFTPTNAPRVFGGVIVTGFKRFLKYSLHLPRISFSLLTKTPFRCLMDFEGWDLLPQRRHTVLPEHFACLPVIVIHFMSEILPRLHFGLFHRECCGRSRFSIPRMRRSVGFVVKPCLVGYFLCSTSIFHLWVQPRLYVLDIVRHTESFPSASPSSR